MGGTRAALGTAAALSIAYVATLAPTVTLWDAGGFASAAATFGIPHPPGTPLYVVIARTASLLLRFLPTVLVTNLVSAASTVVACALLASLVARWTRSAIIGTAAGCMAGLMASVWLNANETEVYAASLLLSAVMLWCAERSRH